MEGQMDRNDVGVCAHCDNILCGQQWWFLEPKVMGNESVESVAGIKDPCMAAIHTHQLL